MAKKEKKVRIYSALEVADICGVVNQTAINWIKNGFLKAFMTPGGQYRVYAEDLLAFLSSRGMRVPPELAESAPDEEPSLERIIIVDDDQNINTLLKRYLSRQMPGRTIIQAFDGFEAGKLISEMKPGIVLLDINLPGLDGYKLCRRIKDDHTLGAPIVIAITGLAEEEVEAAIMAEGADAFFRKPLDFTLLSHRIEELAGARAGRGGSNGR
jgi:two-component system, OmpR family, response regulator